MLIDLRSDTVPPLKADLAVIGAGAAGVSFSQSMIEAGYQVILIESGGLDYESETSKLNAGSVIGQDYYDLEQARLRFFGGTTAIWGGRCAELDPIDFEQKDWVEHSGWPFGINELRPWYSAARALLQLPSSDNRPEFPSLSPLAASGDLAVRHWTFDRQFDRFSSLKNKKLIDHPRLTVLTHATVREIVALASGEAVDFLDVRAPDGTQVEVRAQTFILAAGGLENPRILLASNSVRPNGLGNDHDLVGRFFMEHPHARGGRLVDASAWHFLRAFQIKRDGGAEFAPAITAGSTLQRDRRLLNSSLTIAARPPVNGRHSLARMAYITAKHRLEPTKLGRRLWKGYRRFGRNLKQVAGPVGPYLDCIRGRRELTVVIRAEQAPNPNSRVLLDRNNADAIGMPQIKLDWRLSPQDIDSVRGLVAAFGEQSQAIGVGRVEMADWLSDPLSGWVTDSKISAHPMGGYHHMGTTRMAQNPRSGVTDQWGKVHGVANLYVLGSSLFPTGGWANPTLTIIALALRTADHLQANSDRTLPLAGKTG